MNQSALSLIADILSILGFAITVMVMIDVRRIKKNVILKGRMPDLSKKITNHSSRLSEYLNEYEDYKSEIREELAHAEGKLLALEKKLDGSTKKSVTVLIKNIQSYKVRPYREALDEIYLDLVKLQEEIDDLQESQIWEVPI